MDHDPSANRRYNEKEIGALIQRATELHERTKEDPERSLSLSEIQHIAAELGLPPEHIQRAAVEMKHRLDADRTFSFWGGPFVMGETRVVDGAMSEEQWEEMVLELRRFTGRTGQITEVGRAREWTHALGESNEGISFTRTQANMRPSGDQTRVEIRKHYGGAIPAYVATFVLSLILAILTIVALDDAGLPNLINIAVLGASLLGPLALVRGWISVWAKREKERLRRFADTLQTSVGRSSSSVLPPEQEPTAARIELPTPDMLIPGEDEPAQRSEQARHGMRA